MPEMNQMIARQRKYIFYLLAVYVLGWGFTSFKSIFLGLIFGTSLSFFNLWLIGRKMRKFEKAVTEGKKTVSLGSFSRMATGAFAVIIAMRYPDTFHLISVIIGLMTSYFVIMIDFFLQSFYLRN
ncbi:ATP synthase F0 subunit I [Bacillus methanolicus PB1]|uniref:ATP synthase F0 subunit I n=1 Tax=Bacillus methanolicus PB1 TaxID=997296 RepID=I3E1E1_BACMT|nr:ATP synthase subunit I [Bacillus methanolicus]EIJ80312.1 ATP synthase F0 subunit I [Bacillus methanolicus PB1]